MKNLRNSKVLGLVTLLILALVFVGINFLDAQVEITGKGQKKPKPPEEEATWTVAIPGIGSGNNLFGLSNNESNGYFIYEDKGEGDGIGIVVEKMGRRGRVESQFRLGVFNNIDESGQCDPWLDGPKKIGFQDIIILGTEFADTAKEEYPGFFPPAYPPYHCDDPSYGMDDAPYCMADFLNGYLHPYCDGPHPESSYYYVEISIKVDCDFENITQATDTTGIVWVEVVNTYDLQTGCEYPHNISGDCIIEDIEDPDASISIEKTGVNTWTITVDGTFTFAEIYKGMFTGKGKRWEYKIPYWAQIPLRFETTWTREVTQ